jgi:HEAT repeat protein
LVALLNELPPERQASLLLALGDRKDPPPLPAVIQATKSESPSVREAAVRVIAMFGDPSAVAILIDAALTPGNLADLARERLKVLSGPEIDAAIVERLRNAQASQLPILIELVGARRIQAASPIVRRLLDQPSEATESASNVHQSALAAWAQLAEMKDLDDLVRRALVDPNARHAAAAQAALSTAVKRMPDREATSTRLASRLAEASIPQQVFLLELLGKLGGPKALSTVVVQANSSNNEIKDAATRILGAWPSAEAGPALLELAKNDKDTKYSVRALRGYLRIARQLQLPVETRLQMFRAAMDVAQRDEEKQLALDVLTRIPSVDTLNLAVSFLDNPQLKEAAANAAVSIAPKLMRTDSKAVAAAMQNVIDSGVGGNAASRAQQLHQQAAGT